MMSVLLPLGLGFVLAVVLIAAACGGGGGTAGALGRQRIGRRTAREDLPVAAGLNCADALIDRDVGCVLNFPTECCGLAALNA